MSIDGVPGRFGLQPNAVARRNRCSAPRSCCFNCVVRNPSTERLKHLQYRHCTFDSVSFAHLNSLPHLITHLEEGMAPSELHCRSRCSSCPTT